MKPLSVLRPLVLAMPLLCAGLAVSAQEQPSPAAPTTDPTQVRPGRYTLDPNHGKITWSLSHLGFSTYFGQITGVSADLTLDPRAVGKSTLSVTIDISSVGSLNARLDAHLKQSEFFDAAKFPRATYVSTGVEQTSPTTARVDGKLTIKDITRVVSFDATFNQAGVNPVDKKYSLGFDGRAVIRRSDFGVSAFLPALGDEVQLRLEGEFKAAE